MEHNIGVGIIVGLITTTSIYIWQSESFTKTQKVILLMCIIFPPLQWIGIFILKYYNKVKLENSPERVAEKKSEAVKIKLDSTIENLKDLKEKGILTDEEYSQKVQKLESEKYEQDLKNSAEYKQLKSLFDSGVLTNEEFDNKIDFLSENPIKVKTQDFRIVDGFSEGLGLAINSDLDYGFVDESGEIIIDFKFEHAENFINGIAKVRDKGEFKNIDKKGNFT